jgi:hypothetical protein
MTAFDRSLFAYAALFVIGLRLFSNPRCKHSCKTVAEHIWKDGLDGFVATLIE